MVTPCRHFALLQTRVEDLSNKFIQHQVKSEIGNPTTFMPDLDHLAAYRLLVHAELEGFLEEKAKEGLDNILSAVQANLPWMRSFPSLISLSGKLKKEYPQELITDNEKANIFVKEIVAAAKSCIRDNNGIKTPSFAFLAVCAGKAIDEVDQALSSSLNSYGKGRGDVAHKSVTLSTSLQAPSAELATAKTIVLQLGMFFDVSA